MGLTFTALIASVVMLMAGCSEGSGQGSSDHTAAAHGGGSVRVAALQQAVLDVALIRYEVACEGGLAFQRDVPLVAQGLPAWIDPQWQGHRFADLFFVASPGLCNIAVQPLTVAGHASQFCAASSVTAAVASNQTVEFVVPLACLGPSQGAIDVVGTLNYAPVVTSVQYAGGPGLTLCEVGGALVSAIDPEGMPLLSAWSALILPPAANYDVAFDGLALTFSATVPGTYVFLLTLLDPAGGQTDFEVPFYVAFETEFQGCTPDPLCFVGKCDDGNPCSIDTCESETGACFYETFDEVCDGADNNCNGKIDEDCYCEKRGDVNGSGFTNVADVQCALLTVLWSIGGKVGPAPACLGPADPSVVDVICDGALTVADVQVIISFSLLQVPPEALDTNANGCADACEPDPCGNGICEPQESCSSCPADCGVCPPGG
jgi:hypothetical protein